MLLRILMSSAHLETVLAVKLSTTPIIYQHDALGKEVGAGGLQQVYKRLKQPPRFTGFCMF